MFLFNYYFLEFELETGRTLELDIFHRTATLVFDGEEEASTGSSLGLDIEARRSILTIETY